MNRMKRKGSHHEKSKTETFCLIAVLALVLAVTVSTDAAGDLFRISRGLWRQ